MNAYSSKLSGWLAILISMVAVVGLIFLGIFLSGYFSNQYRLYKFGSYSDAVGALPAVLSAVLASWLYPTDRRQSPQRSTLLLAGVWAGAIFVVYGSWLILSGTGGFVIQGYYHYFGYGLIGIWVFFLNRRARQFNYWPVRLTSFGIAASVVMMVGLLGIFGILMSIDGNEPTPFLLVLAISFIGHAILYTIWLILFGIQILRSNPQQA